MIQVLLAIILLPVAVVLLVGLVGALWTDIRQSPVLLWTLVCFVCFFAVVTPIAAWNDWKRRREIREFNERKAAEAAGKTVTQH